MIAASTRTSIDRTAERCLARLVAAQERGDDIRGCLIEVYAAFARDAAERWHIHCYAGSTLHPDAARLADLALHDQLKVVPRLNAEYFGRADRGFDRKCAAATRKAFNERVRELRSGWSS